MLQVLPRSKLGNVALSGEAVFERRCTATSMAGYLQTAKISPGLNWRGSFPPSPKSQGRKLDPKY